MKIEGKKISQVKERTSVTGNEMIPFQDGKENGKIKLSNITSTGGTTDYSKLNNKPSIEGIELSGDKTLSDIGAASKTDLNTKQDTITTVNITVGNNTGTPSGTASVSGNTLNIDLQNIKGEDGVDGKDGKDGTSINILGSYESLEELQEAHPTGSVGDGYLIQGDLYVWSETQSNWSNVGNIQGPKGDTGEKGDTGITPKLQVVENDLQVSYNNGSSWETIQTDLMSTYINHPDDEDLVEESVSEEKVLKFADKQYNSENFSGLGRVYLRKNASSGKNILTQEMINNTNTRYIIQYDYDLDGKEIILPEGCVLQFEGGSFKNGTINGNNSKIESLNTKIFDKTITLNNFDYVRSEWIGIFPDIDCSEEFEHFTQFGLKILFSAGTYRFTISNLLLSKFTELIGEKSNESVVFVLTPKSEYEYLIGVNYFCTVKDIKIVYSNVEGIEKGIVLLVSNKFNSDIDENVESYYRYNIDNVRIEGKWREDSDYSEDGITAFAVKCNQYDIDGSVIKSKSISWFPRVNRLKVKFAKIGVLIQSKQDSGQQYWCNSLLFTNIDINALYGFYFDRENPYSAGWCVINNYLFQSTKREGSFGLYGYFIYDRISNYLSWDNMYLGSGYGYIFMDPTSLQIPFWKYNEKTVNGFYPFNGSYPSVNMTAINRMYYPTNNYNPSNGSPMHIVDYSNESERIWRPNKNGGSAVRGVKEKITEISSGLVTYNRDILDRFKKTIFQEEISNDIEDYLPTRRSVAYNSKNGYKFLMESCGIPSYNFQVSKFKDNYGFITKAFSNTLDLQYKYKITLSFTSDGDLTNYKTIIRNISVFGLSIDKSLFLETSKTITLYVRPISTYNSDTVQLYITYRLRPYLSSDDTNLIEADCTISYEQLNQFKGTTGQRPTENLEIGDTYYNTDTLTEEVYDGTKWINPDGYVVGARRGTTSARPSLSSSDSGYEYYDTELKKKILWNGNIWVNIDGTNL